MRKILGKGLRSIIGVVLIAIVSFVLGAAFGVISGEANYKIDLCADDLSGVYITDQATRDRVCR
jgi:hypothetical protein